MTVTESMDGKSVGRALTAAIRPVLRSAGFTQFSGRSAWRQSEYTVDLVKFRSFTRYIADGVGCTTFSFTGDVGTYYRCFGPNNERPKDYELTFRGSLGKTVEQRIFHPYGRAEPTDRPEIWFVAEDGSNLDECIADACACLEDQGIPFLNRFREPSNAFQALLTQRSVDAAHGRFGLRMPGNPDGPSWRNAALGIGHLCLDDPRPSIRTAPVLQP